MFKLCVCERKRRDAICRCYSLLHIYFSAPHFFYNNWSRGIWKWNWKENCRFCFEKPFGKNTCFISLCQHGSWQSCSFPLSRRGACSTAVLFGAGLLPSCLLSLYPFFWMGPTRSVTAWIWAECDIQIRWLQEVATLKQRRTNYGIENAEQCLFTGCNSAAQCGVLYGSPS